MVGAIECPMNIEPARWRIFRLQTLAFAALLGLLIAWSYFLQRKQLLSELHEDLRTVGRHLTFSVEHKDGQLEFDESIYLANRSERFQLGADTAVQWLDLEGRVVRSRGGLAVDARPLQDDVLNYQEKPVPAYVYTLQAKASGHPFGYARVAMGLGPVEQKLNRSLGSLCFIGIMLLVGSSWVSWWWTGRALRPIGEAYQELSIFSGAVAHELRSPLTAMQLNSESLCRRWRELPPEELELALRELSQTSIEMSRMVDDLLFLAQLRRNLTPAVGNADAGPIFAETIASLQGLAAKRQLSLSWQGPETAMLGVEERHLKMMLRNLVENALQYTEAGGRVEVEFSDGQLVVRDSGIGMSSEELARIYEPFWRAEKSRARHLGGAGLGLAIVSGLANLHGIDLQVESRPGEGSCFRLRFPGL
jgi:HAMP domain-containing protein